LAINKEEIHHDECTTIIPLSGGELEITANKFFSVLDKV